MQANEFERKVQHTMGQFKIRPSDEVWQKVEERIREKKRERRVLFFILFSSIGLALAGYGVYHFSHRQGSTENEIVSSKKINHKNDDEIKSKPVSRDNSAVVNPVDHTEPAIDTKPNGNEVVKNETIKPSADKIFVSGKHEAPNAVANKEQSVEKDLNANTTNSIIKNEVIFFPNETTPLTPEMSQEIKNDSLARGIGLWQNNAMLASQLATAERNVQGISKKLQWGINLSVGSSVITDNHFTFKNSNSRADVSYSAPGSSTTGGASGRFPPSTNEPVFAFKAGVVIKKQVSPKSNLSAGLQYAYLGDRIKTETSLTQSPSQQNPSVASFSYYRAVPQQTREDRFHFIELPLLYHWRMSKNDKRFISLDLGASPGYLLTTNALIYDTTYAGIYFHDKSLFTKIHLNLVSAISYHVAGANGFEWSIGPQFSFDLSRIIKSDIDQRKYFLYGGIDTRMFFERKKNK